MEHVLAKTILIAKLVELIAKEEDISLAKARERFYTSGIAAMIDDDETGLYGQSPLYIYSLYHELSNRSC